MGLCSIIRAGLDPALPFTIPEAPPSATSLFPALLLGLGALPPFCISPSLLFRKSNEVPSV